ncbi:MAG: class I SAM-dependent methyltransferase [Thermodesulfovibrionales bacterium]
MDTFNQSAWAQEIFSKNFLEKADIYIQERRKMIRSMSSLFSFYFNSKRDIHILDLGCGDGVLTEELLSKDETIIATLVDGSLTMLQKARERLTAYPGMHFIHASFQELLTGKVSLGHFDFCVSSFAIHHLEMKEKKNLFRYIYGHLNAEGHFINIDVVLSPSEGLEEWYFSIWREWMQHMQDQLNVKDELPEDIIRRYKDPSSMNNPDTLEAQLEALRETGFRDVDCYYKNGIFAVFGGKLKP